MAEKKNQIAIIALVVVFVLPVILAKVALENDWFNKGATNQGELLTPPIDFSANFAELPPLWRLVYVLPEQCDAKCANAIYALGQIHIALGKHMDRVEPLIITTQNSQLTALQSSEDTNLSDGKSSLDTFKRMQTLNLTKENVNEMFKSVSSDGIFIVDTLNNGMLKHALYSDKEEAVQASRSILSDIKKLLKLSRIG
ncbi:MAG: Uncharacterised protein [Glaciecola sp. HTCC2999]|jgi:uncharacterized phage infection (PIP) family protein YhgE|nr:MAG: Uncharacterised protein [Glaciecola sp. HTCC2999]